MPLAGPLPGVLHAKATSPVLSRRSEEKRHLLVNETRAAGGQAHAFASDARNEDEMVALIEKIERDISPIDVTVFNIGANLRFSILDTTSRVYLKVWEVACFSGCLTGRETARVMQSAGLDAQRLPEASQLFEVKEGLMAHTQSAFDRGAFGSPTFFVGNEMFFGKDKLEQVEREIAQARSV